MGGYSFNPASSQEMTSGHYRTQKLFLLCNYILLGAASSCIFLTLSLRLLPSWCGVGVILLQTLTIVGAVSGCAGANAPTRSGKWYASHMVFTVLAAILQGSVAVLIFSRTSDFLGGLKSYVREDDGAVILRMAGGLCVAIFCLEWVVMGLAFALRYYSYVDSGETLGTVRRSAKVQDGEMKDWPWPFQV